MDANRGTSSVTGLSSLADWKMQRYVRVRRNPFYWDNGKASLDAIVFRPIESATTEEKMFRSGQLHTARSVPNSKIPGYRAQPDSPLLEGPFMGTYFYQINMDRPPLDNPRVRRAFALAIDRDTLARTVLQDTVYAWANYVPYAMPGYQHPRVLGFDPAEARRLLAEAGYPGGEGFPALTLKYNTAENHRSVAVAVQQMWKQHLNIEVTLANEEWRVYLDTLDNRNYDIARMGWVGDVYPGSYLDVMTSSSPINRTGFSNARYDAIVTEDVRATGNLEELLALYQQAERILAGGRTADTDLLLQEQAPGATEPPGHSGGPRRGNQLQTGRARPAGTGLALAGWSSNHGTIRLMWRFLSSRLLQAIPVILAVITVTFFLVRVAPGGPFDSEKAVIPEVKAALEAQYRLDQPLFSSTPPTWVILPAATSVPPSSTPGAASTS
jgi:hypothetical protein